MVEDVRWSDGTWQALGFAPGQSGQWPVLCISEERWIFGYMARGGANHALIWRPGIGTGWFEYLVDDSKTGYTIHAIAA